MTIKVSALTEADIPGAISAIQVAFAEDPYSLWIFSDRANVCLCEVVFTCQSIWCCVPRLICAQLNPTRNRVSLSIRCHWGIRNALFYVAKDPDSDEPDKVLGIAMWMPPKAVDGKESWSEWYDGWKMWFQQGLMNAWYGRGGLNVKVCLCESTSLESSSIENLNDDSILTRNLYSATISGNRNKPKLNPQFGLTPKDTTFSTSWWSSLVSKEKELAKHLLEK